LNKPLPRLRSGRPEHSPQGQRAPRPTLELQHTNRGQAPPSRSPRSIITETEANVNECFPLAHPHEQPKTPQTTPPCKHRTRMTPTETSQARVPAKTDSQTTTAQKRPTTAHPCSQQPDQPFNMPDQYTASQTQQQPSRQSSPMFLTTPQPTHNQDGARSRPCPTAGRAAARRRQPSSPRQPATQRILGSRRRALLPRLSLVATYSTPWSFPFWMDSAPIRTIDTGWARPNQYLSPNQHALQQHYRPYLRYRDRCRV
jgi:hypothetical protein